MSDSNTDPSEIADRSAASKAVHGDKFQVIPILTFNVQPLKDRFQCPSPGGRRYAIRLNGEWMRVRFESDIAEEERNKESRKKRR